MTIVKGVKRHKDNYMSSEWTRDWNKNHEERSNGDDMLTDHFDMRYRTEYEKVRGRGVGRREKGDIVKVDKI